jgi:outer membrane protein
MKGISGILNVVLIIAVGVLYYLHFKDNKSTADEPVIHALTPVKGSGNGLIAYVNSDSLFDNYSFYKEKRLEIEAEKDRIKSQLKSEGEKLQNEVEAYQKSAMTMTEKERGEKEYQLQMKQQAIRQEQERLLNGLDEKREKAMDELYSRLDSFLKKHNSGKNYSYILGYSKGGGILFANDSLDITKDVISGLNKEFTESKNH